MADHGTCSHVSENGSGRITGAPTGSTRRRLPPLSIGRQLSAAGPLCNYLLRICMYIYIYIYFFSPLNFSFSFWHFLFAFIIHIEVNVSREKRTHFPFRRPHTLIHSSVAGSGQWQTHVLAAGISINGAHHQLTFINFKGTLTPFAGRPPVSTFILHQLHLYLRRGKEIVVIIMHRLG